MAAKGMELVWIDPPEKLQEAIAQYGRNVVLAVLAGAQYIAAQAEADMRNKAKWTDRTGNARSGLTARAAQENDTVVIYLIHRMEYGIFLELRYGGRYSIIIPTLQQSIPEVERMLRKIFA